MEPCTCRPRWVLPGRPHWRWPGRAVELGVTLIDTAYLYGGGANEELLAEALYPYPDGLVITTKVGVAQSGPQGEWKLDGRPAVLRLHVEEALRRLRVDRIELLQLHRIDPETPLAEQLGTLRDMRAEGKIGRIGLSEVTVEVAERTAAVLAAYRELSALPRPDAAPGNLTAGTS